MVKIRAAAACLVLLAACDEKRQGAASSTGAPPPASASAGLAAATTTTPASAAAAGTPGKYPQASTRALTDGEVSTLTCEEQNVMKNEIYARHGYKFKTKKLADRFAKEPWYQASSDNVESSLSKIEMQNVALIGRAYDLAGCKAGAKDGAAPSAAAAAGAASAAPSVKCGPNQHYDGINKKCWAFGECPQGYHWNESIKTCIVDLE